MAPAGWHSPPLRPWCWPVSDIRQKLIDDGIADPMTAAFWEACLERRLVVQRCRSCGHHQFYPRPICLACEASAVDWVDASGRGVIYSLTIVRVPVTDELKPPYCLALVDLDEGPRLLTNIESTEAKIGDRVTLAWRERPDMPPVPVFRVATTA